MSRVIQRRLPAAASLLALFAIAGCRSPEDLQLPEFERVAGSCSSDAQCDDGLACNGVERCGTVSGRCAQGEPILCVGDATECTVTACVEPGLCVSEPDDSLCRSGYTCVAGRGCVFECAEPPEGECDLQRGCGCLDGEGCFGDEVGEVQCSAAGDGGDDDECDVERPGGGCASGWQCLTLGPPGTEVNRCRRVCDEDGDCESSSCAVDLLGVEGYVCTQRCDVFRPGVECPAGTGCALISTGTLFDAYTDCRTGGPVSRGGLCTTDTECAPGLLCVSGGANGAECLGLCRGASDCLSGERCVSFVETVTVDGESVGPCILL